MAAWGDGWYGFDLDGVAAVRERVRKLTALCAESGRDLAELRPAVALRDPQLRDIGELTELGVDELVLVESPPDRPTAAADWVSALAGHWMTALSQSGER